MPPEFKVTHASPVVGSATTSTGAQLNGTDRARVPASNTCSAPRSWTSTRSRSGSTATDRLPVAGSDPITVSLLVSMIAMAAPGVCRPTYRRWFSLSIASVESKARFVVWLIVPRAVSVAASKVRTPVPDLPT